MSFVLVSWAVKEEVWDGLFGQDNPWVGDAGLTFVCVYTGQPVQMCIERDVAAAYLYEEAALGSQ